MGGIPGRLADALADRYTIEREIGAGGMATVYLARDLRHRRSVALKVLRPDLAESLGAERFLREIEVAAGLTHPHIVPLYDSGEAGGFLYYVMPFIDGETLRERLARERTLQIPEAARIFREVVDALGGAHRRGVVHRDVKPGNVLLAGGHAVVADFGVAKAVSEAANAQNLTTVGVALGTPQYMAPEQAAADPRVDHRADIFAAGVVAYEMLTGVSPFAARSTPAVFAALMTKVPDPPQLVRSAIPEPLGDLVMACLAKDPADRPQSAEELLGRLDAIVTPTSGVTPAAGVVGARATIRRRGAAGVVAALVLAVGALALWQSRERRALERGARLEGVPEVIRLAGEARLREAAELALEVEAVLGPDPVLDEVWPRMSTPFRVVTEPAGAEVWYRPYELPEAEWRLLGTTPYATERFPVGAFRFRVELDGYEPIEEARSFIPAEHLASFRSAGFDYLSDPSYAIEARLAPLGSLPDGMVRVTGGSYGLLPISGFGQLAPIDIPEFLIDRTEVTNEAYLGFVTAGGYADSTYWREPFVRDGRVLPWREGMAAFLDATGRPGPATWVLGRFPDGLESHPVAGLSWYEAEAFCRWSDKSLPTLFHWARAAMPSSDVWLPFNPLLADASNMAGEGTVPVASLDAIGVSGAHDLAGNVREWTSTAGGDGRQLAGASWNDTPYSLHDQTVASPWVRLPTDGVRCVRYADGGPPEPLTRRIDYPTQDLSREISIPDDVFAAMRVPYLYERGQPLLARVDSSRSLDWGATVEWVSLDTPYGERLPLRLYVPRDAEPPLQAAVFFPGGNVLRSREMPPISPVEFVARSGRVVVEPVYEGTFQRNDGRTVQRWGAASSRAVLARHWVQDLGRVIDYLAERPDVDASRVAYVGLSFGASLSINFLPYEERFAAAVLYSGGFGRQEAQESIDQRTGLATRLRLPVLMVGGRHDFSNPVSHQEALFGAYGTPEDDKRLRILDEAGHWPLPLNEVIRETVDFLDEYFGPVTPRSSSP
jgi:eukaryotic-like serine/threonine-protein kinase